MILAMVTVAYLAAHLAGYLFWFRHWPVLKREGGIFAFHGVSYVVLVGGVALVALVRRGGDDLAALVLGAGLHGIYSLSFLELWALSHRSFSLSILERIDAAGGSVALSALVGLADIGTVKRTVRGDSLRRLGLLAAGPASIRPTRRGRVCTGVLRGINWLNNGRSLN